MIIFNRYQGAQKNMTSLFKLRQEREPMLQVQVQETTGNTVLSLSLKSLLVTFDYPPKTFTIQAIQCSQR